jgi:hypothetical protein
MNMSSSDKLEKSPGADKPRRPTTPPPTSGLSDSAIYAAAMTGIAEPPPPGTVIRRGELIEALHAMTLIVVTEK